MMLKLIVSAFLMLIAVFAFAAGPHPSKRVDLSDANAMTKLLDSNPAHYSKIEEILRGLENRRSWDVAQWLKTRFRAKDISYSKIMLTTLPGQRDLSFVLGDTRYYGRVIAMQGGGTVFLIRNR
jgi:hypothetical protein